jgi:hypothetical protein
VVQDPNWIEAAAKPVIGVPPSPAPALGSKESAAAAAAGLPRLTPVRHRDYTERTPEELCKDVVRVGDQLYDMSGRLLRERDTTNGELLDAQSRLRFARGWIWVLTLAIGGSWALIALMLKLWLLPILEKVPR